MPNKTKTVSKTTTKVTHNEYDSTLPYVERFRPKKLDDVMSHDTVISTLKTYLSDESRRIPHLLFYGPPGTGKTSTIESFLNELYGEEYYSYMVMNINASEERGIDVVRGKIKNFVNTKPIRTDSENIPAFKFVILDEADAITAEAQAMLRIVIERNTEHARFCLICNCIKKINSAIQSRCKNFKFSPLDDLSVNKKIETISEINGTIVTDTGKQMIWKLSRGDMRKVLHHLQVISMTYDVIDDEVVSNFMKYPSTESIDQIYDVLMNFDLKRIIMTLRKQRDENSYSLKDIMTEISDRVFSDIDDKTISMAQAININKKLRDIEMNMITTSETDQQLTSIASAFIIMRSLD
jgi:replication factor C subunit 3/5